MKTRNIALVAAALAAAVGCATDEDSLADGDRADTPGEERTYYFSGTSVSTLEIEVDDIDTGSILDEFDTLFNSLMQITDCSVNSESVSASLRVRLEDDGIKSKFVDDDKHDYDLSFSTSSEIKSTRLNLGNEIGTAESGFSMLLGSGINAEADLSKYEAHDNGVSRGACAIPGTLGFSGTLTCVLPNGGTLPSIYTREKFKELVDGQPQEARDTLYCNVNNEKRVIFNGCCISMEDDSSVFKDGAVPLGFNPIAGGSLQVYLELTGTDDGLTISY